MGKFKKTLSLCLVLILAVALLPKTTIAADPAHWAYDAVAKLNMLYGTGTFSDEYEENVTIGDLKALLNQTFECADFTGFIGLDGVDDGNPLTRGVLAHTLVKLFNLGNITGNDDEEKINSAIGICKDIGIMSGYSEEAFGEDDPVNHGALAVAFYRAVNKAAGGTETNEWGLKAGAYGYEELLYFAVRSIPFGEGAYSTSFDESVSIDVYEDGTTNTYTGAEDVWNKWEDMLNALGHTPVDAEYDNSELADSPKTVEAVVEMVKQYREALVDNGECTGIFYDVSPSDWFYDGIMYLLNQKIIMGYGDGTFGPDADLTRAEMAVVVLRAQGVDTDTLPVPEMAEFTEVFTHTGFVSEGQLIWAAAAVWAAKEYYGGQTDFAPDDPLTREGMAFAAVELFDGYDEENVNLAILDRFADKDDIGEAYKKPLAYLVSIGVLNGSPGGDGEIYIYPQNTCSRAEAGTFAARVLQGLDKSKMKDYIDALNYVQDAGGDE